MVYHSCGIAQIKPHFPHIDNSLKNIHNITMKQVKITVIRRTEYHDLMEQYENPIEHACEMKIGDEFISENAERPDGLCNNAWNCIKKYVIDLANGKGNFYDGWMKNPNSAMLSCDDGFRPVSFYIETIE